MFALEKQMWNQHTRVKSQALAFWISVSSPSAIGWARIYFNTQIFYPWLCSSFSKTPLSKLQRKTPCPPFCLLLEFLVKMLSLSLIFLMIQELVSLLHLLMDGIEWRRQENCFPESCKCHVSKEKGYMCEILLMSILKATSKFWATIMFEHNVLQIKLQSFHRKWWVGLGQFGMSE